MPGDDLFGAVAARFQIVRPHIGAAGNGVAGDERVEGVAEELEALVAASNGFGRIPEAALWIFDTIGLATFIGTVGLAAGPTFVESIRRTGPSLLLVGLVVAVTPHMAALFFGHKVLKMNPVILFGASAGAGTVTAALRAIQDEAQSKLPVLGYTVPYALGNILLTAWGPVIVFLTK